ncbi:MAG TPA: molybdate ABC transporter substrate-binding protein [Stellaceae bacterium]|nr:molybdate ABC transporter substrate-binding protein [Stellaceae bacterium]
MNDWLDSGARTLAALLGLLLAVAAAPAAAGDVVVLAAASLKNAIDAAAADFRRDDAAEVRVSYGASSALAKQLENGAPADLFISADRDWMDWAEARGLIKSETRKDLLGNRLVLVAPAAQAIDITIKPGFPLASLLGDGRLAVADPDAVPAGKYAKATLETLGVWPSVKDRLASAENVRAALFFVARAEAPLGIVYATDATAEAQVKIVGVFPDDTHPPIVYPIALTAVSANPEARRFLDFLASSAAKPIFEAQGFTVLP